MRLFLIKFFALFFLGLVSVTATQAQNTVPIPIEQELSAFNVNLDLNSIVNAVVSTLIILGSVVLFFYIILGAYKWMTAGGDKARVDEARQTFTNGLIGMAILASIYAISQLIGNFFGLTPTAPGSSYTPPTPQDCTGPGNACLCGGTMCNTYCVGGNCLTP